VTAGLDGAGGMTTLTTGQDAQLTIGSGPGAYAVTSTSNTFADLVPGLSVTALRTSAAPVTVSVDDDAAKLADAIQAMVDATNAALDEINTQTAYDAAKNQASTLTGDSTVRQIRTALGRAVGDAVAQSTLKSGAFAGVSTDRTGKLTFDRDKFLAAYQANPADVSRLFVQGGTGTGSVTFVSAGTRTTDGTHTVVVTQAPTAATDTGLTGGFPLAADTAIRLKVGTTEIHYDATAGESAASVAAGLQAATTAAGLPLAVAEGGGGIEVTHTDVGTFNAFSVAWDGTNWTDHAGTDIAGTIDGVAALGSGRRLASPLGQPGSGGLVVDVAGSGTGPVGTVECSAGIAQRLASVAASATDLVDGTLTTAQDAGKRQITDFDEQIASYTLRLDAYQAGLQQQFATLETTLSTLKNQSSWLASQLGSLGSG
jgi:flagellar hook-associated protein 2